MAQVLPFRGIRYNPQTIDDLSKVVTPPYDVISPDEQQKFYHRHPNNIIRLDLNPKTDADTAENNPHTRAAASFTAWQADGILTRDPSPAVYATSVTFPLNDGQVTRFGFIARVRLEPFDRGIVLPHEKTFSKVKSERLELMKRCHANFSPIFSLYSDTSGIQDTVCSVTKATAPQIDITDDLGLRHKLWTVTDADIHAQVATAFEDKQIFIADGHHRYETALNYREWVAENDPDYDEDHPANYVMMYLSCMEDTGLIVLPAHRLLLNVPQDRLAAFPVCAAEYFDIEVIPLESLPGSREGEAFIDRLKSRSDQNAIGVFIRGQREFLLLTLKSGVMDRRFGDEIPAVLRRLDVTVLTRLILMEILGFDQARLDNDKLIGYSSSGPKAVEMVTSGAYDVGFLLNPTRLDQVRAVAKEGLIMPRKSTYFYPKVVTGQIVNLLK